MGLVPGNSFSNDLRHFTAPVAASKHDRIPPSPNVYSFPFDSVGVDFGPGPCEFAAESTLSGAG